MTNVISALIQRNFIAEVSSVSETAIKLIEGQEERRGLFGSLFVNRPADREGHLFSNKTR